MNPKCADVLNKWVDGNQIYHVKKDFRGLRPPYHKKTTTNKEWYKHPYEWLKRWDCFPSQNFNEEKQANIISRSIIVVFVLLLLVGSMCESLAILAIAGAFIVILLIWYTIIPTTKDGIRSLFPRNPVIIEDDNI